MSKQNTLTQIDFFGVDDNVELSQSSSTIDDFDIPNNVSPPTSSRKKRKGSSMKTDSLQHTFSTFDYDGRGKVTHIMGYTDLWFDKIYIKMMHKCLVDKIDFFTTRFEKILDKFEIEAPEDDVPKFIKRSRRFLEGPIMCARSAILAYDKVVLHVLKKDAVAAVINVSSCVTILDFITNMCTCQKYVATANYKYASNECMLEIAFDGVVTYYNFDNSSLSPVIELIDDA